MGLRQWLLFAAEVWHCMMLEFLLKEHVGALSVGLVMDEPLSDAEVYLLYELAVKKFQGTKL